MIKKDEDRGRRVRNRYIKLVMEDGSLAEPVGDLGGGRARALEGLPVADLNRAQEVRVLRREPSIKIRSTPIP